MGLGGFFSVVVVCLDLFFLEQLLDCDSCKKTRIVFFSPVSGRSKLCLAEENVIPGILLCSFKEEFFLQWQMCSHLCLTVPEPFLRAVRMITTKRTRKSAV